MTGYNLCFADIEIMCARLNLVGPGWTYPDYGTKKDTINLFALIINLNRPGPFRRRKRTEGGEIGPSAFFQNFRIILKFVLGSSTYYQIPSSHTAAAEHALCAWLLINHWTKDISAFVL